MCPFFGAWFEMHGQKQTGYFLGHELVATMQKQMGLQEIAMLTDVENHLRPLLVQISQNHEYRVGEDHEK